MLINQLIFIHKIKTHSVWFLLVFILLSCSQIKIITKAEPAPKPGTFSSCSENSRDQNHRHLVVAAKIKSSVIGNCLKNYLKFEQNKKQSFSMCNQLFVKTKGQVSYVQVSSSDGKPLPRDLEMCIEQEYWKMNFRGLQLDRSYQIKFKMNLSSIPVTKK
jgi:hypothetical protein